MNEMQIVVVETVTSTYKLILKSALCMHGNALCGTL